MKAIVRELLYSWYQNIYMSSRNIKSVGENQWLFLLWGDPHVSWRHVQSGEEKPFLVLPPDTHVDLHAHMHAHGAFFLCPKDSDHAVKCLCNAAIAG